MFKLQFISEKKLVLLLGLFTVFLLTATVTVLNIEPVSDSASYIKMATSMLETGHMNDGQGNVAFYSAGWPLFLIPFFALFGATPEVAQYLNVILGLCSVLLVYCCAKEILPSWKWALFAACLWATYPPAILYAEYIAKENLMVPLLLLQMLLLLKFPNSSHKTRLAILLGIIFGFELLVGPAVILTGAIIGLIVLEIKKEKPVWSELNWRPTILGLFAVIITLVPWMSYTASELGQPVLNTNGPFNLYLGNNPNSKVKFIGIQNTPIGPQWHKLRKENGEIGASIILKKKAIEYIIDHPVQTFWLSIKKIAYFWTPPLHQGKDGNSSSLETIVRISWLIYYCVIVIFALVPLAYYRKLNRAHFILYGTIVLYCLIHAIAYIIFRYRLPIMPIMCILAVQGFNFLYLSWNNKNQLGRL